LKKKRVGAAIAMAKWGKKKKLEVGGEEKLS